MSQDYDQHARARSSGPARNGPTPSDPATRGRRELPVWLQYVGVGIPLVVGLPAALVAIRTTTLDPLFWCLILAVSVVVGFMSIKRSGPGQVALVATAVGVAAAVGAAGSFGYQQGKKSSPASPDTSLSESTDTRRPFDTPSFVPDDQPWGEAEVRHEGRLVLPQDYVYVDLDAPADDPQWGTLGGSYHPGVDFQSYAGELYPQLSARVRYGDDLTDASYAECQSITGYTSGGVSFRGSEEGGVVCAFTDEGRFSRLKFVSYDSATSVLTLIVTTWEKP